MVVFMSGGDERIDEESFADAARRLLAKMDERRKNRAGGNPAQIADASAVPLNAREGRARGEGFPRTAVVAGSKPAFRHRAISNTDDEC